MKGFISLLNSQHIPVSDVDTPAKRSEQLFNEALCDIKFTVVNSPSNVITLQQLVGEEATMTMKQVKRIYETQGVVVLRGFIPNAPLLAARAQLGTAIRRDLGPQVAAEHHPISPNNIYSWTDPTAQTKKDRTAKLKKTWPAGIAGNKHFGFIYAHPESKSQVPSATLHNNCKVYFAMGSAYQANIDLISHPLSQHALAALLNLSGNKDKDLSDKEKYFISWDSAKVFRGDMTEPHIDLYSTAGNTATAINRTQAMVFGLEEGDVTLCFAKCLNGPTRALLERAIGEIGFFQRANGYHRIPKDKQARFIKCIKDANALTVPQPGDLVLWKAGVPHMELHRTKLDTTNVSSTRTERYVIGTQRPVGISRPQLEQLAIMAEKGFFPHPFYNINDETAIGRNSVHKKRTQYGKRRIRSQDEKDRFGVATQLLPDAANHLQNLHPRRLHCYGISQSVDRIFDDEEARALYDQPL